MSLRNSSTIKKEEEDEEYYRLNIGQLPDALYRPNVPVGQWLDLKQPWISLQKSFPPQSLQQTCHVPWDVEMERCIGISLWMIGNVLPFVLPLLILLWKMMDWQWAQYALMVVLAYVATLVAIEYLYFYPRFQKQYPSQTDDSDSIRSHQFIWTERNTTKYLSVNYVWPKLQPQKQEPSKIIYCLIPHALAPFGVVAYPVWSMSQLFFQNTNLTCWTAAPIIFQLPLISYFMRRVGYIPAKAGPILETLKKKHCNVGIILDGIEGMFQLPSPKQETAAILKRKGIVKIALKAGGDVAMVPVYCFGHYHMYDVWTDPFGILKLLSTTLGVSLTPFFGRWGWFLGPPKRNVAVSVCLGRPIDVPSIPDPTQQDIDTYHAKLLDGFRQVFDTHKVAYYGEAVGSQKQLVFVK